MGKWFGWAKQVVKESSTFNSLAVVAGVSTANAEHVSTVADAEFHQLLDFVSELEVIIVRTSNDLLIFSPMLRKR